MKLFISLLIVLSLLLISCGSIDHAVSDLIIRYHVVCWSNGIEIYSGKVYHNGNSWVEDDANLRVKLPGDCVFTESEG
jgi:hypothetical protein